MPGESNHAQVIANYANFVRGNNYSAAARALFLWDYLVTLDAEINYVWGQKLSVASSIFILNRYTNLIVTILELIEQAPFQTPQSCPPVIRVLQSMLVFASLIVAVFATLRVYAIWSRDWRPALVVLLLALVAPISNLYLDVIGQPIPAPRPSVGCAIQTSISPEVYSQIVIATRATTTAYDALVLVLTYLKTTHSCRAIKASGGNAGITALLLRDGTLYFGLLFAINVAQIIIAAKQPGNNFLAFFISPITSILVSRFLLNLRAVAQTSQPASTDTAGPPIISTRLSSVYASSGTLGNMGATLYSIFEVDSAETAEGSYVEKSSDGHIPVGTRQPDVELLPISQ